MHALDRLDYVEVLVCQPQDNYSGAVLAEEQSTAVRILANRDEVLVLIREGESMELLEARP